MQGIIETEINRIKALDEPVNILELQVYLKGKGMRVGRYALKKRCQFAKAEFI